MKPVYIGGIPMALMALMGWAQLPSISVYNVDAGRSSIEIDVFRGGLLKAFGHDHRIAAKRFSGTVQLDSGGVNRSSVSLSIEANSLTVLDPHLSEKERSVVQTTMEGVEVLDVKAFPKILFGSTHVSNVRQAGDDLDITLAGRLNLHGVEKEITFPVHLRFQKSMLRATGIAFITQTDFKITPISVGGGTVRVKDQVRVDFDLVAERANP